MRPRSRAGQHAAAAPARRRCSDNNCRAAPGGARSGPGAILLPLGLVVIVLGWYGAANTPYQYDQLSYLVSGGLLGLGLHLRRRVPLLRRLAGPDRRRPASESSKRLADTLLVLADVTSRAGDRPATRASTSSGLPVTAGDGTTMHRRDCALIAHRDDLRAVGGGHGAPHPLPGLPALTLPSGALWLGVTTGRARPRRAASPPRRSRSPTSPTSPARCPGIFESAQQAARAYVDYFNSTGDICGRKLELERSTAAPTPAPTSRPTPGVHEAFARSARCRRSTPAAPRPPQSCGLPDIRSTTTTPERSDCAHLLRRALGHAQPESGAIAEYFMKKYPDATQNAAFLYINAGAAAANARVPGKRVDRAAAGSTTSRASTSPSSTTRRTSSR